MLSLLPHGINLRSQIGTLPDTIPKFQTRSNSAMIALASNSSRMTTKSEKKVNLKSAAQQRKPIRLRT